MLKEFIKIKGGFVKAVKISDDFFNEEINCHKLESYYVNPSAREAFYSISEGLHPTSRNRVHLISGTYGSGKSHFGLVVANYLIKNSNSQDLDMIFHRIREKDSNKADEIYRIRNIDRPYILILIESYDPDGAEHALLRGLRDALKRENLPEEMMKTSYQSALNKIGEWESKKPDFIKQMKRILEKKGKDIYTLKGELREYRENAYRLFKEIHSDVTLSEFEPIYSEGTSKLYPLISELLIREYQYKGITIIWDQFDEHVSSIRTSDLSREQSFLRDFSEKVERSGENQLHLILISHDLPHEYLRGKISKEALHNWERMEGRFRQDTLEAIKESEELIDYVITQQTEKKQWEEIEYKIEKSTKLLDSVIELDFFPEKDKNWVLNTICKGAFPLHPIVTYCLPWISDVVGQAERTMFTFFEEALKDGGLTKFINENSSTQEGQLNFYTADRLFDFFKDAIGGTPRTSHVIKNYAEAMSKVKIPQEILTKRLMKALAIIKTIKTKHPAIPLSSSLNNLCLLLNIGEHKVRHLLNSLVANQVLWIRASGEYDFRTGEVVVNFEEDFTKAKEELETRWDNPILELKKVYPPGYVAARKYERDFRVARKLFAEYIDVGDLDNIKQFENRIKNEYIDGFVLYVIAEGEREINEVRGKVINKKNHQIVIAVPKRPLKIYSLLKDVKALELLGSEPSYAREDTETYDMWKDNYDSAKRKLDDEISNWKRIENLYWFCGGETLDVTNKEDTDIADSVMYRVFDKTPIVEHRRMANRWEQDQRIDRIKLNTAILDIKKEKIDYPAKGRAPAEKTILEQTFDPHGMLKKRTQGNFDYYELMKPKEGNMKEVWELMEKRLMGCGPRAEFTELLMELQLAPYGLSPRVIELFLSSFFRLHPNRFTIQSRRTKSSPLQVKEFIGDTIYEIVNDLDSEKIVIEYREKLPLEEEYLLTINCIVSPEKDWGKLPIIDGVGILFVEWFQSLPPLTKSAIDIDPEARYFMEKIKEPEMDTNIRELLFEKLPQALEIDKELAVWDKTDLVSFESSFKQVVEKLNGYQHEVVKKAINYFKGIFDVKGDTEIDVMEKIKNWYNELDAAVKEHDFTGCTYQLMKFANIQRLDQFQEKFLVELPKQLGLNEFTQWENVEASLKDYQARLVKAKKEVEQFHRKIAGPIEKKKLSKEAKTLRDSLKRKIQKAGLKREEIIILLEELIEEYRK